MFFSFFRLGATFDHDDDDSSFQSSYSKEEKEGYSIILYCCNYEKIKNIIAIAVTAHLSRCHATV
jgi:hypothetical protein